MSRAKEHSTVYVVADDLDQAVEDLGRSWSVSRRIGWAIDQGVPSRDSPAVRLAKEADGTVPARLRHARLVAERDALAAVIPPDPGYHYDSAEGRVQHLERRLEALEKAEGWGELRGTPVGEAAIAWKQAHREWWRCTNRAEHAGVRERHRLRKQAARAAEREGPLRDAFERLAAPEKERIVAELPEAKKLLAELEGQFIGHMHFQIAHPEALRRLDRLNQEIATAAWEMDLERQDLDGIPALRPEPPQVARGFWRGLHRDAPELDHGIELGL